MEFDPSRRNFIAGSLGVAVGAPVGFGLGVASKSEVERILKTRKEGLLEVTDEPHDVQIRALEERYKDLTNLNDKTIFNHHAWLVSMWFQNRAFEQPMEGDPWAIASHNFQALLVIEDKTDARIPRGYENYSGWAGENIYLNLTSPQFTDPFYRGTLPLLSVVRDVETHEMTHFTAPINTRSIALAITRLRARTSFIDPYLRGFRIYYRPYPVSDEEQIFYKFDEAATELIANHYQRTSGLLVGLPSYDDPLQLGIDIVMNRLEGTLKLANLSIDHLAFYHQQSDLDGLAKALVDATGRGFRDEVSKISYGLSVINAIENGNYQLLGQYFQQLGH